MSTGPIYGAAAGAAGTQRAQTKGSEVERSQHDSSNQARQTTSQRQAEKAAGIGQTEQDSGPQERDADGRRLWEDMSPEQQESAEADSPESPPHEPLPSRDASGTRGNRVDLQA